MIERVIDSRRKDLGGFEVGRVLPFPTRRMVGPFVFLDHVGPAQFTPGQGIDVRPHPHIGLSTVTYLFDGEILHRDNLGYTQPIRPGEVNWMTAGKGIVHSERTDPSIRATGQAMHGMQAWVALPDGEEEIDPGFWHHGVDDLPTYETGGLWARLVAGSAYGETAKVKTHSPLFYIHWEMQAGTKAAPPNDYADAALFVAQGSVEVEGRTIEAGQMAVFGPGERPAVTALTQATVMLMGGEPLGHRYIWWNLVSSSLDRLEQAKADWVAGRFPLPADDKADFIPLPDTPMQAPEPMS